MKHKMWSRLLSMVLAVMMITSIVPNSAFAEVGSEIAASSQATSEVQVEEVPLTEDTTTEEPATETVVAEPTAEPVAVPAPTAEPTAEPTQAPAETVVPGTEPTQAPAETAVPGEEIVTEGEEPAAEPTQAPAETAVPSEQPSAEPTQAPEGTETPEGTAVPTETPVPSETPVPTETPEPTEEPVVMNEEAYQATAQVENADITVTVQVPAGALPVDAELKADLIAEETAEFAQAQAALDEQQVEYDGMIALDIRFEVNGEEIEPLFPVEVTIDAKAMLPEDADPETVAVQHLKENEDGTVTVESVAAASAKGDAMATELSGTVVADGAALVAEFTAGSFSVYPVTWSSNATYSTSTVPPIKLYRYIYNKTTGDFEEWDVVTRSTAGGRGLGQIATDLEENGKSIPGYGYIYTVKATDPSKLKLDYVKNEANKIDYLVYGAINGTDQWGYRVKSTKDPLKPFANNEDVYMIYLPEVELNDYPVRFYLSGVGNVTNTSDQRYEDAWGRVVGGFNDGYLAIPEINLKLAGPDLVDHDNHHGNYTVGEGDGAETVQTKILKGPEVREWFGTVGLNPALSMEQVRQVLEAAIDTENVGIEVTRESTIIGDNGETYTVGQVLDDTSSKYTFVYYEAFEANDGITWYNKGNYAIKNVNNQQDSYHVHVVLAKNPGTLIVEKKFEGIEASEIPAAFEINVRNTSGNPVPGGTLTLDDGVTEDQMVYRWELTLSEGSYQLVELNADVDKMSRTATWEGTTGQEMDLQYVTVSASETSTVKVTNSYDPADGNLVITKTFKNASGDVIDPPSDLVTIEVDVEEYYYVTGADGEEYKKSLGTRTVELTKDNGVFTGTLSGVKYYTEFRVTGERMLDANKKELAISGDYEYTFTFDRNYLNANITGIANQTATAGNAFYLPSNTFILVKNDGSGWSLVMRYLPAAQDLDAVKAKVCAAVELAKTNGQIKGGTPGSADNITWKTLDEIAAMGVNITYQEDGLTRLVFDSSNKWAQFIYGDFAVLNMAIQGSLVNQLKDVRIEIPVEKFWEDNDNAAGLRPQEVVVSLTKADGTVVATTTLKAETWAGSFTNLPKYDANGVLIDYSTYEVTDTVNGYTASSSYDPTDKKFLLTNTLANGKLQIIKAFAEGTNAFGDGRDVFSFKIEDENGKTWYMHVNGAGDATLDGTQGTLTLDAGEYTVTELENINYTFTNVSATKNNVAEGEQDGTNPKITVTVGGNETTIVTFTNSAKDTGMTDGSGVINKFKEEGSTITFDKIWIAHDEDEQDLPQQGSDE